MSDIAMTTRSRMFRRKAAELGRLIDIEADPEKIFPLVRQALSWIQLAENEEALAADEAAVHAPFPASPDRPN